MIMLDAQSNEDLPAFQPTLQFPTSENDSAGIIW
jgi:hypothetical protein